MSTDTEQAADEHSAKAQTIFAQLLERYGEPQWEPDSRPIDELILTILSANTNDINSGRAFDQLKAHFGDDWDAVRTGSLREIKEAIKPAGMYNQKAPNIVETLERIKEDRGNYDLSDLDDMPVDQAMEYLTSLPGVGHKTASIVMLFCFNRGAFPVDTHVQRITQRLGLSPRKASPERVKRIWEELMPPESYYALHIDLIRHGRTLCKARMPQCDDCPLADLCDYNLGAGEWADHRG